jgi:mannose-6-phosphate isomerase-like protein (cupin superfamily)
MTEQVIIRGPGEGRTLLVGGGDYVTYKTTSAETGGDFFSFEMSTVPGFGPPMHKHDYRELFYVLEGSYEFTIGEPDGVSTVVAGPGTTVAVPPNRPHTFKNASGEPARMLCVQQHATLEGFFEEFGVEVDGIGAAPAETSPPDFAGMAAALQRNGVTVIGAPEAVR